MKTQIPEKKHLSQSILSLLVFWTTTLESVIQEAGVETMQQFALGIRSIAIVHLEATL